MRSTFSFLVLNAIFLLASSDPTADLLLSLDQANQGEKQGTEILPHSTIDVVVAGEESPAALSSPPPKPDPTKLHNNPLIFTFETDNETEPTREIISQIEEALVLAAKEVNNPDAYKVYGIMTKSMGQELLPAEDDDEDVLLRAVTAPSPTRPETGLRKTRPTKPVRRPTPRPAPIYRVPVRWGFRHEFVYHCEFCYNGEDDDLITERINPRRLGNPDLTMKSESTAIKWQRRACHRLRKVKGLESASKCFLYLDLDHDDPIQSLDSFQSVFLHNDFYNDGFTVASLTE